MQGRKKSVKRNPIKTNGKLFNVGKFSAFLRWQCDRVRGSEVYGNGNAVNAVQLVNDPVNSGSQFRKFAVNVGNWKSMIAIFYSLIFLLTK